MVGAQERLPDVAGHQGDAEPRALENPALQCSEVTWDRSHHVSELQCPLRQGKVTPGRVVLRSQWVRGHGWMPASNGCQSGSPGGGPLSSQRCAHSLLQPNFFIVALQLCHTKAVSNCKSPLASVAPSAAWHSCSVSTRARGWDVSMMAMVSPSSVHMIVC